MFKKIKKHFLKKKSKKVLMSINLNENTLDDLQYMLKNEDPEIVEMAEIELAYLDTKEKTNNGFTYRDLNSKQIFNNHSVVFVIKRLIENYTVDDVTTFDKDVDIWDSDCYNSIITRNEDTDMLLEKIKVIDTISYTDIVISFHYNKRQYWIAYNAERNKACISANSNESDELYMMCNMINNLFNESKLLEIQMNNKKINKFNIIEYFDFDKVFNKFTINAVIKQILDNAKFYKIDRVTLNDDYHDYDDWTHDAHVTFKNDDIDFNKISKKMETYPYTDVYIFLTYNNIEYCINYTPENKDFSIRVKLEYQDSIDEIFNIINKLFIEEQNINREKFVNKFF